MEEHMRAETCRSECVEEDCEKVFFACPREDCFDIFKVKVDEIINKKTRNSIFPRKETLIFLKADFCQKEKCDPDCKVCNFKAFCLSEEEIQELRKEFKEDYNAFIVVKSVNKDGKLKVCYNL